MSREREDRNAARESEPCQRSCGSPRATLPARCPSAQALLAAQRKFIADHSCAFEVSLINVE